MIAEVVLLDEEAVAPGLGGQIDALAAGGGPGAYCSQLVAALANGGMAPAVGVDGEGVAARVGYVLVRRGDEVLAAAPVIVTGDAMSELLVGGDALRRGSEARGRRRLGARTLVVGSPLAQRGGLLRAVGVELSEVLPAIEEGLEGLAEAHACHAILWKDLAEDPLAGALERRGYAGFVTLPGATIELSRFDHSMVEYLRWIGEVASAGDLLRKAGDGGYVSPGLRAFAGVAMADWGARAERARRRGGVAASLVYATEREPADMAAMHALYVEQRARARFGWETLGLGFFARSGAEFATVRAGEKLLGFSSAVQVGDRWISLRSGIAAEAARVFALPTLLVLRDVETALLRGCRAVELGPTSYALKAKFGARFVPTRCFLRLRRPYAGLTEQVAGAIDGAHRQAGIGELHAMDHRRSWTRREG
jgi:hypothetical protein